MIRMKKIAAFALVFAFAFSLALPCAFSYAQEDDIIGITNRYKTLKDLSGNTGDSDSVIVSTRVGVLTSVNRALNGAEVSFTAEAIGDILRADSDHKWVNVLGADAQEIGVYMSNEDASKIEDLGSYKQQGTTLYIEGIYSVACSSHEGELDIHASLVKVMQEGQTINHDVNKTYLAIGILFMGMSFLLLFIFFKLRKFREKQKSLEELWR